MILFAYLKDTIPEFMTSYPTLKLTFMFSYEATEISWIINSLNIVVTVFSSVRQTLATDPALRAIIGALRTFYSSF